MNFTPRDEQTIIAICTPQGSGAIGLLRLSGDSAVLVAEKISTTKLSHAKTHTIHYGHITSQDGKPIDEVMLLLMKGPRSFTGEDTVEITCHNNVFVMEQILNRAIKCGARRALPGEFSKRAFLNDKIDLLQAEGINEVISAQNEQALSRSMKQLEGTLSGEIEGIEVALVKLLAYVEASFEFLDEEQRDIDLNSSISDNLNSILKKITDIKGGYSSQKILREGVKVALIGHVNAGKSTLFNTLIKENKAIVTDIPGTTRDTVEAIVHNNGSFWTIVDTAGLRTTDDIIENIGIEKSFKEASKADIVLLVFDSSKALSQEELYVYKELQYKHKDKIILVANKSDLESKSSFKDQISISAHQNLGTRELFLKIEALVHNLFSSLKSPFLINKRQHGLLCEAERVLLSTKEKISGEDYELIAYALKDSLEILSELTGKNINENVIDRVFSGFCVGK